MKKVDVGVFDMYYKLFSEIWRSEILPKKMFFNAGIIKKRIEIFSN